MSDDVALVHVVVPARDEAELLPGCLRALDAALDEVRRSRPGLTARLTVVLDACVDESAAVCRAHEVEVLSVDAGNVGLARATGVSHAAGLAADGADPGRTWIVCTDADSVVPVDWLTDQLAAAEGGADVVLGRVEPDLTAPAEVVAAWHALHGPGRIGVHGAHLGFRLSAYDAVGGLAHLDEHEDADLVDRLLAAGARCGVARTTVLTSSRLVGRTGGEAGGGGFAGFLADLHHPLG